MTVSGKTAIVTGASAGIGAATARIIYMVDVQFSTEPDSTDEGRLPWDYLGAELGEQRAPVQGPPRTFIQGGIGLHQVQSRRTGF